MTSNFDNSVNENFSFHNSDLNSSQLLLEGDIYNPDVEDNLSTLNEPIRDTIVRDLRAIGVKFWHVLYPKNSTSLLREWDLWGPLFLCTIMSIVLETGTRFSSNQRDGGPQFGQVFILFWAGSSIVTINAKLLGVDVSFLQTVCILGYCVLPLTVAIIICAIIGYYQQTMFHLIAKLIISMAGFAYSTFSSTAFLNHRKIQKRKALVIYPICLFYFFIAWMSICQKS